MPESELQVDAIDMLNKLGYWVVRVIHTPRSGVMDLICCSPKGQFVGIELKVGKNKPSDLQKLAIQEVLDRGGVAFTAWSLADIKEGLAKGYREGSELIVHKAQL